jgi:lipopolysaccharide/colanic/teichoic acid biosynthesis glycosyltransferase
MSSIARPKTSSESVAADSPVSVSPHPDFLDQELFLRMLRLERKRTERSHRHFVLMLLESCSLLKADEKQDAFGKVVSVLSRSTRETDIKGWYKDGVILGVIFTELGAAEGKAVTNALLTKVTNALSSTLSIEQINEIKLSFHVFPEQPSDHGPGGPTDSALYPDLAREVDLKRASRWVKRGMDIAGSLFALVLFSPLIVVIAAAIKVTSKGPVLFRQVRIGRYGRRFTFLKFRSMYFRNDHAVHQNYVKRLIAGTVESSEGDDGAATVYKLTNDPRVTPVGRFLRRTSLDEFPQFLNVLCGQMSLVGPRPPVAYEFECYDTWHKQRIVALQPGITGLWQVTGRSRTKFDEMVRLDLKYASSWSPWLDIKILLQTPRAVVSGEGAY